jgi:hypothetical protein
MATSFSISTLERRLPMLSLLPLRFLLAVFFGCLLLASSAAAQIWWVQSADYGAGNRRQDVTNTVRRLVSGPSFRVNNNTMGGDPWKGADKTLRIVARDPNGSIRDFKYGEGATVNSSMFRGAAWNGGPGGGQNNLHAADHFRAVGFGLSVSERGFPPPGDGEQQSPLRKGDTAEYGGGSYARCQQNVDCQLPVAGPTAECNQGRGRDAESALMAVVRSNQTEFSVGENGDSTLPIVRADHLRLRI